MASGVALNSSNVFARQFARHTLNPKWHAAGGCPRFPICNFLLKLHTRYTVRVEIETKLFAGTNERVVDCLPELNETITTLQSNMTPGQFLIGLHV